MQPDSLVIRLNQAKTLAVDITFFEGPGLNCCKPKPKEKRGQTRVLSHAGRLRLLLSANDKTLLNSMRPVGTLVQDSAPGSGTTARPRMNAECRSLGAVLESGQAHPWHRQHPWSLRAHGFECRMQNGEMSPRLPFTNFLPLGALAYFLVTIPVLLSTSEATAECSSSH
jgi:hypothetical protein